MEIPNLLILTLLLAVIACKKPASKELENAADPIFQDTISKTPIQDQAPISASSCIERAPEHYYISAVSGLNYRTTPKGKVLGKFPLNQLVKAIEYTGVLEEIKDGNEVKKGEWYGIEKGQDTVYVFNAFLSQSITFSDLAFYYANPYYKSKNQSLMGFVNVSESYPYDYESNKPTIIHKEDIGKDRIPFNQKQRKLFLERTGISNLDSVFIYNIPEDKIFKFSVGSLPVVAIVNGYSFGQENLLEYEYELGFNLKKNYSLEGANFAYIGKTNPFQTGELKTIVWNKIRDAAFPVKFNSNEIPDHRKPWFADVAPAGTFKFSNKNLDYYIQKLNRGGKFSHRYLMVVDAMTNKIVYEKGHRSSESIYLMPLRINGIDQEDHVVYQWTGTPFKNKPAVVFGFLSNSFGCDGIDFLKKNEPPILILCDNRH